MLDLLANPVILTQEAFVSDGPDSLMLRLLRSMDGKLDRLLDDVQDLKLRMTNAEEGLVGVNRRLDRLELRGDRIERRLGLADGSA
jgi:hypothetical protein